MGKYDKKSVSRGGSEAAPRESRPISSKLPDNPELAEIGTWLETVRFRKKAVGGVDPADVWKKIEELNGLYEKALLAERVRYNLLIRQLRLLGQVSASEETDGT